MKKVPALKSENGFTLVEVLIALTIFAIGLLALASMQISAIQGNSTSQRVTAATTLAEGAMEWLQSLPSNDTLFDTPKTNVAVAGSPFDLDGGGSIAVTYDVVLDPPVGASASYPNGVVMLQVKADPSSSESDVVLTSLKWVR